VDVSKYQIEKPGEKEMFDLLFTQGKGVAETCRALEGMGIKSNPDKVSIFKRKVIESIIESDRAEHLADYALDSTERIKIEFNDIMAKTKEILETAQLEGSTALQLEAVKELRAQIELALKKQGQLQSAIRNTMLNIQNNILTTSDIMEQMEKIKVMWFETGNAMLNEQGQIVFQEPSAEMVDLFKKWKFSKEFSKAKVIDIGTNQS